MRCDQESRAVFKTRWYNGAMNIRRVSERSKRDYLQLLLLADEQEDMIDRYLGRGTMFALDIAGKTVGVCVVTDEGDRMLEIKNLAVDPPTSAVALVVRSSSSSRETQRVPMTRCRWVRGTARSRCPFTRHAVSCATTASRISSSTTTTTLSWRQAFCLKIWFTCGEVCKAMG